MEYDNIKEWMIGNRIDCVKYNYSLEKKVQNFSTFDGQIQLSEDGKYLYIYNRKPVENDLYIEERDPEELQRIKMIEKIMDIEEKKCMINDLKFDYHKMRKKVDK